MEQSCRQMELSLFAPPAFDELLSRGRINNLDVRFNDRLKKSWKVKINAFSGRRTLFIPSHFEDAPEAVKAAFIEWAMLALPRKRRKNAASRRKRQLEHAIGEYVESSGKKIERVLKISPGAFQSAGRVYDLQEVFAGLNAKYFGVRLESFIRWNKSRWRSYQTTFMGHDGKRHNLISIARSYNHPEVPRFAIEGIVYHEMLHIAVPPFKRNCQNVIHGIEFKRAERAFPYFKEWRIWEKQRLRSGQG
jgi:hypothetical protein